MLPVDGTKPVRPGEEIDAAKLGPFLESALGGRLSSPVVVEQFPGGHSNLTYLVRVELEGAAPRELVLRRPPFGNQVKTAHDMGREVRVLSALAGHYDKAPRTIAFSDDDTVLGSPFYVMERVRGVILRRKLPAGVDLDAPLFERMTDGFVDALAELHALPLESTGLIALGKPEGYVERQVTGWTKRYEAAKTDDIPEIDGVATWLAANLPTSRASSVIHNDFKFDNLVLAEDDLTKVRGVLDWEMATVGDPMMDVATTLSYWIQADDPAPLQTYTFGPTNRPGAPTRRQVLDRYAARRPGVVPDDMRFYMVFALFKNAVVAQQIYARYKRGLTKDERFAAMIFGVRILADAAADRIATGAI